MNPSQVESMIASLKDRILLLLSYVAHGYFADRVSPIILSLTRHGATLGYKSETPDSYLCLGSSNASLLRALTGKSSNSVYVRVGPEWDGQITFGSSGSSHPRYAGGDARSTTTLKSRSLAELRDLEVAMVYELTTQTMADLLRQIEPTLKKPTKQTSQKRSSRST